MKDYSGSCSGPGWKPITSCAWTAARCWLVLILIKVVQVDLKRSTNASVVEWKLRQIEYCSYLRTLCLQGEIMAWEVFVMSWNNKEHCRWVSLVLELNGGKSEDNQSINWITTTILQNDRQPRRSKSNLVEHGICFMRKVVRTTNTLTSHTLITSYLNHR